jgi:hypothetical protein
MKVRTGKTVVGKSTVKPKRVWQKMATGRTAKLTQNDKVFVNITDPEIVPDFETAKVRVGTSSVKGKTDDQLKLIAHEMVAEGTTKPRTYQINTYRIVSGDSAYDIIDKGAVSGFIGGTVYVDVDVLPSGSIAIREYDLNFDKTQELVIHPTTKGELIFTPFRPVPAVDMDDLLRDHLTQKFKFWDRTRDPAIRLEVTKELRKLADLLGVASGGQERVTVEKRIRRALEEIERQQEEAHT